jgi:hypothetical protein
MSADDRDDSRIADGRLLGWVILFAVVSLGLIFRGEDAAYHLNPFPIDGTLHMFNPLRRIASGQSAGANFQVYHGVLLPYLYYPAFVMGGASLFGAELARQLYTPLALILGYLAVFAAFTRSARDTLRLSVLAILATIAFRANALLLPGASEFGVRTAPILLVAAFFAMPWLWRRRVARRATEGIALGLAVAVATEQGIALIAAYLIVRCIELWHSRARRREAALLTVALVTVLLTFVAILLIIGGPRGSIAAIVYNFGAVPQDQFWYFGALPSVYAARWLQVFASWRIVVPLLFASVNALWWAGRFSRHRVSHPPRTFAFTVLAVYAPLSAFPLLARWTVGYTDAAVRVLIIVALYAADRGLIARVARRPVTPRWSAFAAAIFVILGSLTSREIEGSLVSAPWHFVASHIVGGQMPRLAPEWQVTIQVGETVASEFAKRAGRPPTVWSTYSGLFDAMHNSYNPSFDYAIDALGARNRTAYIDAFRRTQPDIVQTVSPAFSLYEEWMEDTRWELYHELLMHYRVAAAGPWSVFWERLPGVSVRDSLLTEWVRPHGDRSAGAGFRFAAMPDLHVFEAEVTYKISNPWKVVPLVSELPRFLIETKGGLNSLPIPLPSYRTVVRFPVVIRGSSSMSFVARVESLVPGASLEIESIRLHGIPLTAQTYEWARLFAAAADMPKH